MYSLLNGYSLWQYFTVFFDYIPKVVYFLYAAFASCLDAMQLLLRRLAGLDIYYRVGGDNDLIWGSELKPETGDPVIEFIYGVLGWGDNAGAYQALNTTFISLMVFAVIVLVITTMVAIIKAHYQEDSGKTSPVQYIYTAIKAIFTFCIVPFAVIIGVMLSNFFLSTLDKITAGSASSEAITGIYGTSATEKLEAKETSSGEKQYSRYDFFGFGEACNSTSFSGLMFKAAAYDANRVRRGYFGNNAEWDDFYTFDELFGAQSSGMQAASDKREYCAYQIDYAFQNNLKLNKPYSTAAIYSACGDFLTIGTVDVFAMAGWVNTFSKYNVGLVWAYYDLWYFNFMVGIASIVVCFGIFVSIIIGLMSRLIKSVVLFIIYPPTLGLAPMDDFGAFKKWRSEFIQQILMAFGSVIGMNLFFLVLPYLTNISFFNIALIDSIVNVVIMVTGLMMIKSLVSFFSGLVGGADALKSGDELKGEVGKTLATSAKIALGAGGAAMALGTALPLGIGLKTAYNKHAEKKAQKEATDAWGEKIYADAYKKDQIEEGKALSNFEAAYKNVEAAKATAKSVGLGDVDYKNAYMEAKRNNLSDAEAEAAGEQAYLKKHNSADLEIIKNKGYSNKDDLEKHEKFQTATKRIKEIRHAGYRDEDNGKLGWQGFGEAAANMLRNAGGRAGKALMEGILPALKIDPNKVAGITRALSNKKFDEKGNVTGQYWKTKEYDTKGSGRVGMVRQLGDAKANAKAVGKALGSTLIAPFVGAVKGVEVATKAIGEATAFGNKPVIVEKAAEKQTLEATKQNTEETKALASAVKEQGETLKAILKKL